MEESSGDLSLSFIYILWLAIVCHSVSTVLENYVSNAVALWIHDKLYGYLDCNLFTLPAIGSRIDKRHVQIKFTVIIDVEISVSLSGNG